jgi:hypothetical protein
MPGVTGFFSCEKERVQVSDHHFIKDISSTFAV